jgi:hypothetical protein
MNKIVEIRYVGGYRLWLRFQDGYSATVDFITIIGKGVSAPLLDVEFFKQARIDNGGGIEWPNGFDCCPNFLRDYMSHSVKAAS